ncbi:MAG: carboxypeptidase-like regulatory domain-containing protein, partial [Acidobacteriota bacterium]|nr:carboxypeptidase-like regulatory domain-containing protein [Acidobacteriota bacterium]
MKAFGLKLCTLLALSAVAVYGQTLGEITGHVSDATEGAVAGATVTLTSTSTNAARTTTTTDAGDYSPPSVPPGGYNVRVEHRGFKAAVSNGVEVQVQQTVRLDFTLEVGQVSESVEVQAVADQLQQENATVGTVIENRGIIELPLNGREYLNLVALSPNTNTLSPSAGQAGSRQGGDRANQSIAAAGQRIMFDYFTLDGVSNTDPNFNTYVVLPSIDAL